MRRAVVGWLSAVLLIASVVDPFIHDAGAETTWPERQVRILVTFPPGSANDAAARIFADALAKRWGTPVVIENKTGAENSIGVAAFVAAHDDHTLLYTVAGSVTITPLLLDKVAYDVERDLVPVVATTSVILTIAVTNNIQAHTFAELIEVVRRERGKLAWASGPTLPHYVFAAFLRRNGLEMNYVTYRDASQPQADLGEGRIHLLMTSLQASLSPVQSGKARFLAIANSIPVAMLPGVPTVRELGHEELTIDGASGLFGWRGMPEALRDWIAAEINIVAADPDVRRRVEATGQIILGGTPADFRALIADQKARVAEVATYIDLKSGK